MKIIDLVSKIVKNQYEEIPKNIKYDDRLFTFIINDKDYYCVDNDVNLFGEYIHNYLFDYLNDEVEIIEDKKIEKINNTYYHEKQEIQNEMFKNKINEIIDFLNKEDK